MASSVSTINSLLDQFQTANDAVVSGLASGANVASAEDTRNSLVTQLAQQIGVTTSTAANGSMSIYTDSGVTLFQDTARTVSFTPTPTYVDGDERARRHGRRRADHGSNSPMPIQSGALAGYAALRDTLAPQYEAQLDQIAGGLINAFSESDQSRQRRSPRCPASSRRRGDKPALDLGRDRLRRGDRGQPERRSIAGRRRDPAARRRHLPAIRPTSTIRPAQRVTRRGSKNSSPRPSRRRASTPSAGLGTSASLADYANASVSWLQGENQQASNASDYQNALATQATSALSNATGVNLDAEMTNMLSLENTYASSAKLLTTVNEHVLRSAGRRMTMSPNFVSTQYLANSLVLPVQQAQAQLDDGDDRRIDRPIRRSRPPARRSVRLRIVAEGAGRSSCRR